MSIRQTRPADLSKILDFCDQFTGYNPPIAMEDLMMKTKDKIRIWFYGGLILLMLCMTTVCRKPRQYGSPEYEREHGHSNQTVPWAESTYGEKK